MKRESQRGLGLTGLELRTCMYSLSLWLSSGEGGRLGRALGRWGEEAWSGQFISLYTRARLTSGASLSKAGRVVTSVGEG